MNMIFRIALLTLILGLHINSFGYTQNTFPNSDNNYEQEKAKADSLYANHKFDEAIPIYESLLEESTERVSLYEPLTKSYAYLGMFEEAEKRTSELYLSMASEDLGETDLFRSSAHCRYALFKTMQKEYEQSLAHVDSMIVYSAPEMIYPGAPACAVRFETRAGAYKRAARHVDLLLKNTSGANQAQYLTWAIYVAREFGQAELERALMQQVESTMQLLENGDIQISESLASAGITNKDLYVWFAEVYALQGQIADAVNSLQQAHEAGHMGYYRWKNEVPMFDALKESVAFKELLANMEQDIEKMRLRLEENLNDR